MPITVNDPVAQVAKYIAVTTYSKTSPRDLVTLADAQAKFAFAAPIIAAINATTNAVLNTAVVPAVATINYIRFGQQVAKAARSLGFGVQLNQRGAALAATLDQMGEPHALTVAVGAAHGSVFP